MLKAQYLDGVNSRQIPRISPQWKPSTHLSEQLKVVRSCAENLRWKLVFPIDEPISCKCQHGYHKIVYDICWHGSQEINANEYSTDYQEVISLPRSYSQEPSASSEDNSNLQFPSSHFDAYYHHNEMIMDEKNNDIERKRESPMSISHSVKMESNGVSLPEFSACKSNNNLVLLKSLIRKKPQKNSRIKRVPTDNNLLSKLLNRNRPQRDSARKKSVLAVAMTEEVEKMQRSWLEVR